MLVGRVLRQMGLEIEIIVRGLIVNVMGSSVLTPRPIRFLLYRLGGVKTKTIEIFPRCVLGERAHLGRRVGLGWGTFIDNTSDVYIGDYTIVGPQSTFITSGHPVGPNGVNRQDRVNGEIHVGEHCWIGARALILPSVTIGNNTVVAAGAVVTRDCEPWSLYAGVPARKIRDLREEETASQAEAAATVDGMVAGVV
jgi:maltose O-acetyltransferase